MGFLKYNGIYLKHNALVGQNFTHTFFSLIAHALRNP